MRLPLFSFLQDRFLTYVYVYIIFGHKCKYVSKHRFERNTTADFPSSPNKKLFIVDLRLLGIFFCKDIRKIGRNANNVPPRGGCIDKIVKTCCETDKYYIKKHTYVFCIILGKILQTRQQIQN